MGCNSTHVYKSVFSILSDISTLLWDKGKQERTKWKPKRNMKEVKGRDISTLT